MTQRRSSVFAHGDPDEHPPHQESLLDETHKLQDGDHNALDRCLAAVDKQVHKREGEGLNTETFFLGVMNTILITYTFGAFPQYFWILYSIETLILFPIRWSHQIHAKPLNCKFYWLDFCWIANFLGNLFLGLIILADFIAPLRVDDEQRLTLFCFFWGVGCGPLLLAAGLLGNALVFHSVDHLASVFIHLFPSMGLYHMRWNKHLIQEAFPNLFYLDYMDGLNVWTDIYLTAFGFYLIWWLLYTVWLLLYGIKAHDRSNDTIFHANMRGLIGQKIGSMHGISAEAHRERVIKNEFDKTDALIYMGGHVASVTVALLVSIPCFVYQWFHGLMIMFMATICVHNGAAKYTWFILKCYPKVIKEQMELAKKSASQTGSP